jgi:hypothetical protein
MGIFVTIGFGLMSRESVDRRDQNCLLFEGDHLRDVTQLRRTYKYLSGPNARRNPGLTRLVVESLPETEAAARVDTAPPYCDETTSGFLGLGKERDVGLPEPDPVLPKHRDFRYLLKSPPKRVP